jgi:hypothetical protein
MSYQGAQGSISVFSGGMYHPIPITIPRSFGKSRKSRKSRKSKKSKKSKKSRKSRKVLKTSYF